MRATAAKLIVANWKMNPESLREAREWLRKIKSTLQKAKKIEAVICPPSLFLSELSRNNRLKNLSFGGQDAFWEKRSGPFTGQLSPVMFRNAGAAYLILGHSETRSICPGESVVNRKIKTALTAGFKVILCVGERERDDHGAYFRLIQDQLHSDLRGLPRRLLANLLVAYEPLWAIGERAVAADTAQGFLEQKIFIKRVLATLAGSALAAELRVLYGGSVDPDNAYDFLFPGEADGLLVGRASLRPDHFSQILKTAAGT